MVGLAAAVLVACGALSHIDAAPRPRFKAVAFDYFVLFNPDSIVAAVERIFPGKGRELTNLWRTRQFEYTWLRSLTGRYADFFAVTEDALVFATKAMKIPLSSADKQYLLDAYLHLAPWPDAADALRRLRQSGVRVVSLANFSPTMLRSNAENSGLIELFEALVSTDANHTYKPDPRAYRLGMDRLRLRKQDILFVAFGGWDAAGAKSFGYTTYWVNRFNQPVEELGIRPDQTSRDLDGLLEFVLRDFRPTTPDKMQVRVRSNRSSDQGGDRVKSPYRITAARPRDLHLLPLIELAVAMSQLRLRPNRARPGTTSARDPYEPVRAEAR